MAEPRTAKVVVLGRSGVGKTCLAVRLIDGRFDNSEMPTIGAAFRQTELDNVRLDIWDTAGQERYQAIAPLYYRGANVAVIVYDVMNKESLGKAKEWYEKLRDEDAVSEDVVVCIAGNKCDCTAEERAVPLELGELFAKNNGLLHYETSAKTGQGVREMFARIVRDLPEPGTDRDDGKLDIIEAGGKGGGKKKKGCC
jgi:Ras-related protein Rab-5C